MQDMVDIRGAKVTGVVDACERSYVPHTLSDIRTGTPVLYKQCKVWIDVFDLQCERFPTKRTAKILTQVTLTMLSRELQAVDVVAKTTA